MSHVNRLCRSSGREVFRLRVVQKVSPYLCTATADSSQCADATRRLFELLDGEHGCVVGSNVQALLCFTAWGDPTAAPATRTDLNVLLVESKLRACIHLFRDYFGIPLHHVERCPHYEFIGHVSSVYVFERNSYVIRVAVATSQSVLPALLASRTTSQMNALTRNHILSFQPHLTIRGTGLLAWPAVAGRLTSYDGFLPYSPAPLAANTTLRATTKCFLGGCGRACPRLWRQVAGLKGVGIYSWGDPDEVVPFARNRTLWRIGCLNKKCPNRGRNKVELAFLDGATYGDVVRYAHVGRQARNVTRSLLGHRFFDHGKLDEFWRCLDFGLGGITGSAPVWITQSNPVWNPLDLNTVVANKRDGPLRRFLKGNGWLGELTHCEAPPVGHHNRFSFVSSHEGEDVYMDRTWRYTKKGRPCITLTETADRAVFRYLTLAAHTMATMLLTRTSVIALHAYECSHMLSTWRAGWGTNTADQQFREYRVALMGGRNAYFVANQPPCGSRCLGVLRRLRGGAGVGLLSWRTLDTADEERRDVAVTGIVKEQRSTTPTVVETWDTVAQDAYDGFQGTQYSFGWTWCTCDNDHCETFNFPRQLYPVLPRDVVLSPNPKENTLLRVKEAVTRSDPVFPQLYYGVLFPTSCVDPMLVPVPLDHGRMKYSTMDDLRSYTWITARIEGVPPYPFFLPPYEVTGSPNVLSPLAWREEYEPGRYLLVFMTSIHPVGPVNNLLSIASPNARPVHGDVLLMLEDNSNAACVTIDDAVRLAELFEKRLLCTAMDIDSVHTHHYLLLEQCKWPRVGPSASWLTWLLHLTTFNCGLQPNFENLSRIGGSKISARQSGHVFEHNVLHTVRQAERGVLSAHSHDGLQHTGNARRLPKVPRSKDDRTRRYRRRSLLRCPSFHIYRERVRCPCAGDKVAIDTRNFRGNCRCARHCIGGRVERDTGSSRVHLRLEVATDRRLLEEAERCDGCIAKLFWPTRRRFRDPPYAVHEEKRALHNCALTFSWRERTDCRGVVPNRGGDRPLDRSACCAADLMSANITPRPRKKKHGGKMTGRKMAMRFLRRYRLAGPDSPMSAVSHLPLRFSKGLEVHQRLSRLVQYAASAAVITAYEWVHHIRNGSILRERSSGRKGPEDPLEQFAYITMIGRVGRSDPKLSPIGSHNPSYTLGARHHFRAPEKGRKGPESLNFRGPKIVRK
ncbi:hypothetical protein C8R47DRAFT_1084490 [Mycena vitilis]|nr:hypothetical protein C8R47DRAFT_1084490 [Mycena vitilis]